MLPGDICVCISNFSSNLPGELLLFKNDIVQIHRVIDKLWLEGKAAGVVGKFPKSVVVKAELPLHPDDLPLFVATADFDPIQEGDLRLRRGNFVIGLNEVDDAWWYGESAGKKGVFPTNFVWEISKDLMTKSCLSEKTVCMKGKVLISTHAQLPEEVGLYAGDIVVITNIIDNDWYRGISGGQTGIFPTSCIEVIEDSSMNVELEVNYEGLHMATGKTINDEAVDTLEMDQPSALIDELPSFEDIVIIPDSVISERKNIDNSWKNIDKELDDSLFEDNYFKQNMPSMYKPSTSAKHVKTSSHYNCNDTDNNASHMTSNALENLEPLNSLSAKVEDYFNNDIAYASNAVNNETLQDLLDIDFIGAYTEDNTGIHPYGRAIFSFSAQYTNELSFKKGDVIHLIKHIDSHWTVGRLGLAKGIFPTSYIDILVDCPYKAEENFENRPEFSSQESFLGHALVCFDFTAINDEDVSVEQGDIVIIRRYINDEWVEVQKDEGSCGMVPLNHLKLSEEKDCINKNQSLLQETFEAKATKRNYQKSDFQNVKNQDLDSVLSKNLALLDVTCKLTKPINESPDSIFNGNFIALQKGESEIVKQSKKDKFSSTKRTLSSSAINETLVNENESDIMSISQENQVDEKKFALIQPTFQESQDFKDELLTSIQLVSQEILSDNNKGSAQPSTPTYQIMLKPKLESEINNEQNLNHHKKISRQNRANDIALEFTSKENIIQSEDTTKISSFPEDIASKSQSYSSDASPGLALNSLELAPQRPAPPPPLNRLDSELEEMYSIPCGEDNDNKDNEPQECVVSEVEQIEDINMEPKIARNQKMLLLRRESVNELVTTEHEYIHDLEALIQVIKGSKKIKETGSVDLKILMGNISEVVYFAKKFATMLDSVSYEKNECMMIGPVFMEVAEEMCNVYKVYSSNNSLYVGPLLKKYKEGGESAVFLNWVLQELRQHKINLFDMQSVLIKPVQRVLKYPLFIDNLLQNTPPSHPDYNNLGEARKMLLNAAKEINEYTKRLDLVTKYRTVSSHSFGEIIHKVSMRSVAKKGSRIKTRISATMGLINQTRDLKFEEDEAKFHSVVKAASTICDLGEKLLANIKERQTAALGVIEAVAAIMLTESRNFNVDSVRNVCREICTRLFPIFEKMALSRVVNPTKSLLLMCKAPERLILKRYDKLLDYDTAQNRLDKNRDPARTRILEEELSQAKGIYEALNKQLLLDLPILNNNSVEIIQLAMQSLVSARMNLEGHIAKLYFDLAQFPEFSFQANPDYLTNFKSVCGTQAETLKKLSFLSPDFALKSPKFGRRRSSFRSLGRDSRRKISKEKIIQTKKSVIESYDESSLYLVTSNQKAFDQFDLDLPAGTVVGVLKTKDPLGNDKRWFVDDGEKKGFVSSSALKKYQRSISAGSSSSRVQSNNLPQQRTHNSDHRRHTIVLPDDSSHNRRLSNHNENRRTSAPSEIVAPSGIAASSEYNMEQKIRNENAAVASVFSSTNPANISSISLNSSDENPPKYDDLFPHEQEVEESRTLDCKSQAAVSHRYDFPPTEVNDYDTATYTKTQEISEPENSYEEILQVNENASHRYTNLNDNVALVEEPIYETIPEEITERILKNAMEVIPQAEVLEPQFYYALYKFGGSDENQLSLYEGQVVLLQSGQGNDWWFVEDRNGKRGYVPASYLSKYS